MKVSLLWLAAAAPILLSSCTAVQERMEELNQPTPRHLDSSPETTGLLIVDADLRHKGSLSFGIESSVAVVDGAIRRAATRDTIRQGTLKHLLVFQLPPGTYELASVRGHFRSGNMYHTVEPFLVTEVGPIEVSPAQVTYVGKLSSTAHSKLGQLGFTYSYAWNRDPSREAAALEIVERQYPESSWSPILRKRLATLGHARMP